MRILLIAPQPFYEDRGTPIAVRDTIVAMRELNIEVDLATFPVGSDLFLPHVKVVRTANPLRFRRVPVGLSLRKIVLNICLLMTVLRLAKRNRYSCIHGVEEGAGIALVCRALFSVPVIYDMQSSLPEQLRQVRGFRAGPGRWLSLLFERWLVKGADCIIASRGLAQHVLSIESKKAVWECSFDGCNPRSRNEELARRLGVLQRPTVVYTGNFSPYQGLEHLLEAAAQVRKEIPGVLFLLVGGTKNEINHLSLLLTQSGLSDTVQLHPRRPREEIPDYLALADVLVLPRINGKNAPLKIYDYMRSGKPIVATDIPAHKTLLSDRIAILVNPEPRALAAGIVDAIQNNTHARSIALAAEKFSRLSTTRSLRETIAAVYYSVTRKSLRSPDESR
jgi:glycosyltransferase involved in cell wall biosynthesis